MHKKISIYFLFIIIITCNLVSAPNYSSRYRKPTSKPTISNTDINNSSSIKKTLDDLYQNVTGFGIPPAESKHINEHGGADTYGEITLESLEELKNFLNLTKDDVFVDLGSGVGKVVVFMYLETDAKKCKGVELSKTRNNHALAVKDKIQKSGLAKPNKELEFVEENMMDTNLNDSTVAYTCSTCFSDALMKNILEKFCALKPGFRVITLRELPRNNNFTLMKTLKLPMTWSKEVPVYIYKLVTPTNKNINLIEDLYKNLSGFTINNDEIKFINENNGVDTYGEITPEGVEILLDDLKPKKNDVFYDLGTGIGKMPVHVHLATPVKKSVGIELSPTRCNHANSILNKLKNRKLLDEKRELSFINGNILNSNISDATLIYFASTCFDDKFMKEMLDIFLALKPGLKVLSLRKFPKNDRLKEIKEYKIPMTWSVDVPVYLYQLSR